MKGTLHVAVRAGVLRRGGIDLGCIGSAIVGATGRVERVMVTDKHGGCIQATPNLLTSQGPPRRRDPVTRVVTLDLSELNVQGRWKTPRKQGTQR